MQKNIIFIFIFIGLLFANCSAPTDKQHSKQEIADSIQDVLIKKLETKDCLKTTWEEYCCIKKGVVPSYCVSENIAFKMPKCSYYVGEKYSQFDAIERILIQKICRKDNFEVIAYVVKYTIEGESVYFPIPHLNSERKVINAFYEDIENTPILGLTMWLGLLDWSK